MYIYEKKHTRNGIIFIPYDKWLFYAYMKNIKTCLRGYWQDSELHPD